MADEISTVQVLVQAQDPHGNDPIEANADVAVVPRVGDRLEVWVPGSYPHAVSHGEERYLEVTDVTLCTYAPERIAVLVSTNGYTVEDLRETLTAMNLKEQP